MSDSTDSDDLAVARGILKRGQIAPALLRQRGQRVLDPGDTATGRPALIEPGGVIVEHRDAALPGHLSARVAAVIGRACVERWVAESLQDGEIQAGTSSMRTRLTLCELFGDAHRARSASLLWAALSEACHHHAFEYPPNAADIAVLLDRVEDLRAG